MSTGKVKDVKNIQNSLFGIVLGSTFLITIFIFTKLYKNMG